MLPYANSSLWHTEVCSATVSQVQVIPSTTVSSLTGVHSKTIAIMKKIFNSFLTIAAAAIAFSACQKAEVAETSSVVRTFQVAADDTKTVFSTPTAGKYPVLWTDTFETISVVVLGVEKPSAKDAAITPSADGKTATISYVLSDEEAALANPAFYFISPKAKSYAPTSEAFRVIVPVTQTSGNGTVDENAQLLYGATTGTSIAFHHFTAYAHMAITGLPSDAAIEMVTVKTAEDIAGEYEIKFDSEGKNLEKAVRTGDKTITVNTSSNEMWFGVAPVAVTDMTVTAVTSKGNFVKEIKLNKTFESGMIGKFTVDMTGINPESEKKYVATALSSISATDKVVIAMQKSDGSYYAMSNDKGTGAAPAAILLNVKDNATVNPAENLIWNIAYQLGSFTVSPDGVADSYLYVTNNNNGVRVGTSANKTFTVVKNYIEGNDGTNKRTIGVYNNADFRCYKYNTDGTIQSNIADQNVVFFVLGGTPGPDPDPDPDPSIKDVTVAQFNAAAVSETVVYRLTGTVGTGSINTKYGNFDLVDATGTVYVYGLDNIEDVKDKLVTGAKITVTGTRGDYNGKIEVLNGHCEKIESGDAPDPSEGIANTKETAYTTSQAIAIIESGKSLAEKVYVKGTVTRVATAADKIPTYKNADIYVTDGSQEFEFFRCKDIDNTDMTSAYIKEGDELIAYGQLSKFEKDGKVTYELAQGCYLVSYVQGN